MAGKYSNCALVTLFIFAIVLSSVIATDARTNQPLVANDPCIHDGEPVYCLDCLCHEPPPPGECCCKC
ncbi:hypothetical protein M5689_020645 [Euphorbia peplus]|nr:hypothetical protein M5689_020645 [Euphorbia peplus]